MGLRQFCPKFGGVGLMDNFKGKKQQHTQQINKMFYVLKKKERSSNKVCVLLEQSQVKD